MSRISITGGIASGRRIIKVPGKTRPTPAKMRRALFDILGDITEVPFIDLFTGSGIVGIEAISRGASPVIFVEIERRHIEAIHKNIEAVALQTHIHKVIKAEALGWLKRTGDAGKLSESIIFASPPYIENYLPKVLESFQHFWKIQCDNKLILILQFPSRNLPGQFMHPPMRIHRIGDDVLIMWYHE